MFMGRPTLHRNSQAVFAALGLGVILVWALVMKRQDDARTFLRTEKLTATISDVRATVTDGSRYNPGQQTTYYVELELADKKHIRFIMMQAPPETGAEVPVTVDIYDDGKNYYRYNMIEWQLL